MTKNEIESIQVKVSLGDLERLRSSASAYNYYHTKYEKLLKIICDKQKIVSAHSEEVLQQILNEAES